MMKPQSLEGYLRLAVNITSILLCSLSVALSYLILKDWPLVLSILIVLIIIIRSLGKAFYNKVKKAFDSISQQISVIENDDFSCSIKPTFRSGSYRELFDEMDQLKESLRFKQRCYDERTILILNLIGQFENPVILVDHKGRLTFANQAFSDYLGKDWNLIRLIPITQLGFSLDGDEWVIERKDKYSLQDDRYKVFSSRYLDEKGTSSLLILTNITSEIQHTRKEMWKNSIRVFSHEINNSITPIKSLAETLKINSKSEKEEKILGVIVDRCKSLGAFISKYKFLFKHHNLNITTASIKNLIEDVTILYPKYVFQLYLDHDEVRADIPLLKQAFINLVKNAIESMDSVQHKEGSGNGLEISFSVVRDTQILRVSDSGQGIKNYDNVFVPFYSTKPNGQGVGLIFCRHVADLHGGRFTLKNKDLGLGAIAELTIPLNTA